MSGPPGGSRTRSPTIGRISRPARCRRSACRSTVGLRRSIRRCASWWATTRRDLLGCSVLCFLHPADMQAFLVDLDAIWSGLEDLGLDRVPVRAQRRPHPLAPGHAVSRPQRRRRATLGVGHRARCHRAEACTGALRRRHGHDGRGTVRRRRRRNHHLHQPCRGTHARAGPRRSSKAASPIRPSTTSAGMDRPTLIPSARWSGCRTSTGPFG